MKSILLSVRPEWVTKILNGEKIVEIRKTMPKCELPIDVYIYCTKNKLHFSVGALMFNRDDCFKRSVDGTYKYGDSVELMGYSPDYPYDKNNFLNGKVVAKFRLEKVKEWHNYSWFEITRKGCISDNELSNYSRGKASLYIWHISDLVIFDRPRELCEFHTNIKREPPEELLCPKCGKPMEYYEYKYLTRAPQSWQYVEVDG